MLAESLQASFQRLAADAPVKGFKQLAASYEAFSRWLLRCYDAAVARDRQERNPEDKIAWTDRWFAQLIVKVQDQCSGLVQLPGIEDFPDEIAAWSKHWICEFGGYDRDDTGVALVPDWPYLSQVIRFPNPLTALREKIQNDFTLTLPTTLETEEKKYPSFFVLFTLPRIEGRDVLYHPILLHEFAHAIDYKNSLMQEVWKALGLPGPDEYNKDDQRMVKWIREFLADLLATHLAGPCFVLALHQLSTFFALDRDSDTHPSNRTRLSIAVDYLEKELKYLSGTPQSSVEREINGWALARPAKLVSGVATRYKKTHDVLLSDNARRITRRVVTQYCNKSNLTAFDHSVFTRTVYQLVEMIRDGLPPVLTASGADLRSPMPAMFNAAWELWLNGDSIFSEFKKTSPEKRGVALPALSGLVLKGIEAEEILREWKRDTKIRRRLAVKKTSSHALQPGLMQGAVLTESELHRRREVVKDLTITPLLERRQIGEGSINLRLGTNFIITRVADLSAFRPDEFGEDRIRRYQERVTKMFGEEFVVHPGRLVLAATLEYIALPKDCAALVLSRSSYGRLGLIVATAVYVHPCWKGCLTLELSNAADIPIGNRSAVCNARQGREMLK